MMMTNVKDENGWVYRLLVNSGYRWLRHLVIVLMLTIISYNYAFITYEYEPVNRHLFWVPFLFLFTIYMMAGYFNLFYLVPRFFLARKVVAYICYFSVLVFTVPLVIIGMEYYTIEGLGLEAGGASYFAGDTVLWLTYLSEVIVLAISLSGVSITIILKHWLEETQELNRLAKKKIEMEVEQIKEQVNPTFLFRILHSMGDKARRDSQNASAMVLHLSRLLRYQLYDGKRTQVLLKSEIQYMNTYLVLEQYENREFQYSFLIEGEVECVLLPPLLFLPLLQQAVGYWKKEKRGELFSAGFQWKEEHLFFYCDGLDWEDLPDELCTTLLKRVQLLFPNRYRFEDQYLVVAV